MVYGLAGRGMSHEKREEETRKNKRGKAVDRPTRRGRSQAPWHTPPAYSPLFIGGEFNETGIRVAKEKRGFVRRIGRRPASGRFLELSRGAGRQAVMPQHANGKPKDRAKHGDAAMNSRDEFFAEVSRLPGIRKLFYYKTMKVPVAITSNAFMVIWVVLPSFFWFRGVWRDNGLDRLLAGLVFFLLAYLSVAVDGTTFPLNTAGEFLVIAGFLTMMVGPLGKRMTFRRAADNGIFCIILGGLLAMLL
jgi:hypothetical protein